MSGRENARKRLREAFVQLRDVIDEEHKGEEPAAKKRRSEAVAEEVMSLLFTAPRVEPPPPKVWLPTDGAPHMTAVHPDEVLDAEHIRGTLEMAQHACKGCPDLPADFRGKMLEKLLPLKRARVKYSAMKDFEIALPEGQRLCVRFIRPEEDADSVVCGGAIELNIQRRVPATQ